MQVVRAGNKALGFYYNLPYNQQEMGRQQFLNRRVRRTTVMSAGCIGVLCGIAGAQWGLYAVGWASIAVAVVGLGFAVWKRRMMFVPLAVLAGVLLGAVQASSFVDSLRPYTAIHGHEVRVEGLVAEDPAYSDEGNRQIFLGDLVFIEGEQRRELSGELFISTPMSADVRRHDRVVVEGKLQEGFGAFQGSIFYADITKIAEDQHAVDELRSQFAASTTSVLPEPHASLGLGFVIGMKSALPASMEEALRNLALTHVVVASGYNLTILVRAAKRLREKRSKLQTLLLSFSLIGIFLFVTGNSPSMVRAAAVSGLALLAWYWGRQFKPHFLLLLVMATTAFYNPTYLWGDLGWWLSFAAFAGIMIVAPLIIERFWKDKRPSFVGQIAIEALVAQVMTMPIIMLVFGDLSFLGVIANVLVVPLVPFAMLATAVAGFAGMLVPVIAPYLAIPAHALLSLIVSIIDVLSAIPGTMQGVFIGMPVLLVWYGAIGVIALVLWARLSRLRRQRALMQQIV